MIATKFSQCMFKFSHLCQDHYIVIKFIPYPLSSERVTSLLAIPFKFVDVCFSGVYEVAEDQSRHEVSPLWCASVANKLEVVKTLVQHGANVNMPSDTNSTPVRSACFMTNIAVIKYLVDHGADIHKPNVNGGTCLINSIQSSELCRFLITKGADVNAVDNSKNTALQYAIREGVTESVKLLLERGADVKIKNDFGDDALQTAAVRGNKEIVDVIVKAAKFGDEETIRAYELLGTNFVDEKNDMSSALQLWRTAMALRYKNRKRPILKTIASDRKSVYCFVKEPETCEELEALCDPEEIQMQALLIRERILGPYHKDTAFGLMYRGAVYADSHRYQRCVDLWKYAYTLRFQCAEPLNHDSVFTIQALVKLFWEIQIEIESGALDEKIIVRDAVDVVLVLTDQVIAAQKCLVTPVDIRNKSDDSNASDFQLLMQLWLHMVHLLTRLDCTDRDKRTYISTVRKLVLANPICQNGLSLLHLAVDPNNSLAAEEYYSTLPALEVVIVLISCGADINVKCEKGNSPLFTAAKFISTSDSQQQKIIEYLLEKGAHIDSVNNEGYTPEGILTISGHMCPFNYVTLKCLASRVIIKENLEFRKHIPMALIPFVEHHGKNDGKSDMMEM